MGSLWTLNSHHLALIGAPENHQETLPVFLLNLFSLIIIKTMFLLLREMEEKISRIPTKMQPSLYGNDLVQAFTNTPPSP